VTTDLADVGESGRAVEPAGVGVGRPDREPDRHTPRGRAIGDHIEHGPADALPSTVGLHREIEEM
jgi:hypothetical protein